MLCGIIKCKFKLDTWLLLFERKFYWITIMFLYTIRKPICDWILIKSLTAEKSDRVPMALDKLGRVADESALPFLTKYLMSDNLSNSGSAMTAMVTIGSKAVPILIEGLASDNRDNRRVCAVGLTRIEDERRREPLKEYLQKYPDGNPNVTRRIKEVLGLR